MSTAENKKLIQDAFTAWARGDGMAFFNLLAADVRWTVIGSTPVSRTYPSREAFERMQAECAKPEIGNLIAEDEDSFVDRSRTIMFVAEENVSRIK